MKTANNQMTTKMRQQLYEKKQLERMQKARQEKQRKNAIFERGEPALTKNAVPPANKHVDQIQNQIKPFNERKMSGPYAQNAHKLADGRYPYHRYM